MIRVLVVGLLAMPVPVLSQTSSAEQERSSDLVRLQARVEALKAKLAESERKAADAAEELKRLDLRLEIATQESRMLASRREELARTLEAIEGERDASARAAERSRAVLIRRARVLHRFGRYGYFRLLLEARDWRALLDSLERLDSLARRDGRLVAHHRSAQERLARDSAREAEIKKEIDGNYARSRRDQFRVASLREQRERFLASHRRFAESRRGEVVVLTDKAARLERLLELLSRQSSEEPAAPSGSIRPWKGVLDWPARGTLLETFGRRRHPRFDAWTMSNGIAVAMPEGTPVRAVYAGRAVYARWLAEYGNLVILDHGDGIFTLYAWLQAISVNAPSPVPVGTVVGTAGTGPGRDQPGLYFELRDRQKAADPVAWLR